MNLNEFMKKYYTGLSLTPDFYHQWNNGVHLELGNDIYQFNDNHQINMKRFDTVYKEISKIVPVLFNEMDEIFVVVNSYPTDAAKVVYPNFFKRYVKDQKLKYSLNISNFNWEFDEDNIFVQQMSLLCKVSNLKLKLLLKTLIHEDFQSLKPRLKRTNCVYAPDVFLINVNTKCIFHLYDDRGCEIINVNKNLHDELLEKFSNWKLQAKP